MSSKLPPPPDPFDLPYNLEIWNASKPILRVHHSRFGATEFNPGVGAGRFHPLHDATRKPISTIYGSNTFDGALSETIFHDIPVVGPGKRIAYSTLMPMLSSTVAPIRPLRLVQLRGYGLRKLGVSRVLIDCNADEYATTRIWATALYHRVPEADGLIWMSRQHDPSEALVLFGTRVHRDELAVVAPPRPLFPPGSGWNDVLAAADAANITIVMP